MMKIGIFSMKEIFEFPVCIEIAKQFLAQEINISLCRKCKAFPRRQKPRKALLFWSRNRENRRFSGPENPRVFLESEDFLGTGGFLA